MLNNITKTIVEINNTCVLSLDNSPIITPINAHQCVAKTTLLNFDLIKA